MLDGLAELLFVIGTSWSGGSGGENVSRYGREALAAFCGFIGLLAVLAGVVFLGVLVVQVLDDGLKGMEGSTMGWTVGMLGPGIVLIVCAERLLRAKRRP